MTRRSAVSAPRPFRKGPGKRAAPSALGLNRRDLGEHAGRPTHAPLMHHCRQWRRANMPARAACRSGKAALTCADQDFPCSAACAPLDGVLEQFGWRQYACEAGRPVVAGAAAAVKYQETGTADRWVSTKRTATIGASEPATIEVTRWPSGTPEYRIRVGNVAAMAADWTAYMKPRPLFIIGNAKTRACADRADEIDWAPAKSGTGPTAAAMWWSGCGRQRPGGAGRWLSGQIGGLRFGRSADAISPSMRALEAETAALRHGHRCIPISKSLVTKVTLVTIVT